MQRNNYRRRLLGSVLACAGLAVSGCATNLAVTRLNPSEPTRAGIGYVLPFTQYKATVTWRVAECKAASETEPSSVSILTKVELADGQADDMAQAYVIDPTQLETLFSIGSFKVTMHPGTNQIATINAASEDRTAQVIGTTAAGIGKLALALAAPGAGEGAVAPEACTPETRGALEASKVQKTDLEILTNRVKAAQAAVKAATDKVAAMGAAVNDATKDELAVALTTLTAQTRAQAVKADELAESLSAISRSEVIYWPEASDQFETTRPYELNGDTLDKWASVTEETRSALLEKTRVYFAIEPIGSFGRVPEAVAATETIGGGGLQTDQSPQTEQSQQTRETRETQESGQTRQQSQETTSNQRHQQTNRSGDQTGNLNGLPYRMPAMGRVIACASAPCTTSSATIYATLQGPVAQLGFVNTLPVRTRRFGSTTFAAELTALGALQSAGYEQRTAPAEGLANAFSSIVGAAAPLIDYEAGSVAREQAAELAELEFLKKRRDAIAALQESPNAASALSAEALSADAALNNARIADLNSQILLIETQRRLADLTSGS